MIASLVAYQTGEVTISDGVKEKLMGLGIVDRAGKIKIKDHENILNWLADCNTVADSLYK